MKSINLNEEKAWITFTDEEFQKVWFPVELNGVHLDWDSNLIMNVCRMTFQDRGWGISPTSQMLEQNACRDNF